MSEVLCSRCSLPISGALIFAPYGPECGPPAPVHYACRLREIYAREQERRRLEAAAPALLEALEKIAEKDVSHKQIDVETSRELFRLTRFQCAQIARAAVALALPPSEETQ